MQTTPNRFGINMTRFMRTYEADLLAQMARIQTGALEPAAPPAATALATSPAVLASLIERHNQVLLWMEHERLIHLIVTCLTAVFLLFAITLAVLLEGSIPALALTAIALPLSTAYLIHYFRLENTVQCWHLYSLDLLALQQKQE